jgi:tetratricopeptide (TPR) repeat protein
MPRLRSLSFLSAALIAASTASAQDNAAICKDDGVAPEAAIAACTRIISTSKAKTNDLASTYYNRAISYRQKGEIDSALADYNEAIRINPKHARAFNNRGTLYKEKGDLDRAIADFGEAIRLDPKFAAAYFNRGNAYDDKGDDAKALADLEAAIKLDPKNAAAFTVRGVVWRRKGDFDRAVADFTQAIELDPGYAIAYANRGDYRGCRGAASVVRPRHLPPRSAGPC